MPPPFLIIETGQPVAPMRRHRGFPHWIRVAAGLPDGEATVVNVEAGEALPAHQARTGPAFAGVIVSGSAAMVTDRADWSERSAAWLGEAVHAGMPVFGICYGHQLLAHALGGRVGDNPRGREMGTVEIRKAAPAGDDPLFHALPAAFTAQATHVQSVLSLPEGTAVLAGNDHDPHHAFRCGDRAWGVQFHPEFSTTHMRGYVHARRVALAREGLDPAAILGNVGATPQARRVLRRFVHHARQLVRA